jgi:serine/threonine-protein kinase
VESPFTAEQPAPDKGAEARAAELIGKVISGRYRIDAMLAMGGMGAVYRGRHTHLKKRVAIKVLRPETENLPELVARFEREAIAGAHVSHPNVAAATDFGQLEDGSYFLALEYVPGKTLHQVIREEAPLQPGRAVRIGRQIAEGLAAIHAMGIIHRDLKPRNVMLVDDSDDVAKLIDLGLAKVPVQQVLEKNQSVRPAPLPDGGRTIVMGEIPKPPPPRMRIESLLDDRPRLTDVGMIVGTVAYLAPEAALGMDAVDFRADLYALGLVLYQMLAGKHPFEAPTDAEMFQHQRATPPPPFVARSPELKIPPALEAVVLRLLEKDPSARFASATEVVEALDFAMNGRAVARVRTTWRDQLAIFVGASAIGLGVLAALIFNASSHGPLAPREAPKGRDAVAASAPLPVAPARASASPPMPSAPASAEAPGSAAIGPNPPDSASAPDRPGITASAPSAEVAGQSPRSMLLHGVRVHDLREAETAFLELGQRDVEAFHEPDMSLAARDLAVALDREGRADRLFDVMTNQFGPVGLDLLYDLVATRGKASAALRAATMLRRKGVLARATPEMRIAFELREAPCVAKLALLDRAVNEGDARALVVLETQGAGCFKKHNRAISEAMQALRARLRKAP